MAKTGELVNRRTVAFSLFATASLLAATGRLRAEDAEAGPADLVGSREAIEALTRSMLPQLAPAHGQPVSDMTFPFAGELLVSLVANKNKDAPHLQRSDVAGWNKDPQGLLILAIDNLDARAIEFVMAGSQQKTVRYFAPQLKDGFDAARILVRGFRQFFAKQLGSPFLFVVPNRDTLVCWDRKNAKNFQTLVRSEATREFSTHPYPLTDKVFQVTRKDEIRLAD